MPRPSRRASELGSPFVGFVSLGAEVGMPMRDGHRSTWSCGPTIALQIGGAGGGDCARPVWICLQSLEQCVSSMSPSTLFGTAMAVIISLFARSVG